MIDKKRLIDEFCEYVKIDSESGNEKPFYNKILQTVKELGFTVKIDDCGEKCGSNANNIYAVLKGDNTKKSRLIVCHMDTVPASKSICPIVGEDYITSDGTTILGADDKSAVASFIEAVRSIKQNNKNHRTIEAVFTIGEELGLLGSQNFDTSILKSKQGLVFDISKAPNCIVTNSPYKTKFDIKIKGKSAHAGINPEDGISSAMIFANAVNSMKLLKVDNETTANIGRVYGGTGSNVVMSELNAECEVRSINKEKHDLQLSHMIKLFENSAKELGGKVETTITNQYSGYEINRNSENFKNISSIISSMGRKVEFVSSGGGSDANVFISKGLDVLNIGTGMENIHSDKERIKIEDFVFMTELIYNYFVI